MFKSLTKVLDAIDEALPDQEEFDFNNRRSITRSRRIRFQRIQKTMVRGRITLIHTFILSKIYIIL
jgi:hypothetical protein